MLTVKFNPMTNRFDVYKKVNTKSQKEVLEESLTHEEINEKISDFSNQIFSMMNALNSYYIAIQKHPSELPSQN